MARALSAPKSSLEPATRREILTVAFTFNRVVVFFGATLKKSVPAPSLCACLRALPSLVCLCLTECAINAEAMAALPSTLRSLRLSECVGLDDAVLALALKPALRYLDVETSQRILLPGAASNALQSSSLRFLRLSGRVNQQPLVDFDALADALKASLSLNFISLGRGLDDVGIAAPGSETRLQQGHTRAVAESVGLHTVSTKI